ncbi:MAG: hypothetical protein U1F11_00290 [Steroidobacteraceae bacterium]
MDQRSSFTAGRMPACAGLVDGRRRRCSARARRQRGQHPAFEQVLRGGPVEADALDARMRGEEGREIVDLDAAALDRTVEAAGAHGRCAHVPERDARGLQAQGALRIFERGLEAEQRAHDPPERVLRLRVVLVRRERCLPGQRAEHQHARIGTRDRREAAGRGGRGRPCRPCRCLRAAPR